MINCMATILTLLSGEKFIECQNNDMQQHAVKYICSVTTWNEKSEINYPYLGGNK